MFRLTAILVILRVTACIVGEQPLRAADPPAVDQEVRRVEFDKGSPGVVVNQSGGWTVTATGKYRYDRRNTFKELRVEVVYAKGADSPVATTFKFTDESTVAAPGTFSAEFRLRPPAEGEVLTLKAALVTANPAGALEESSSTQLIPAPK
jgi:hypothetical protein